MPGGSDGGDGVGESVEDLDQALDDSLDGFDDAMGGQSSSQGPDEIDILSPSGGGGGVQSDSDAPLFEGAEGGAMAEANSELEQRAAEGPDSQGSSEGGSDRAGGQGAARGQQSSGGSASENEQSEIIPLPEDVGDGRGDDIVLRQIRDAAMKETDPILREKLWDEYRRIKNQ